VKFSALTMRDYWCVYRYTTGAWWPCRVDIKMNGPTAMDATSQDQDFWTVFDLNEEVIHPQFTSAHSLQSPHSASIRGAGQQPVRQPH